MIAAISNLTNCYSYLHICAVVYFLIQKTIICKKFIDEIYELYIINIKMRE